MKLRYPDLIRIYTDDKAIDLPFSNSLTAEDIAFSAVEGADSIKISVKAESSPLRYLRLRWNFTDAEKRNDPVKILGDHWERGYGDLAWRGIEPGRVMPWYILVSNGSDRDPDNSGRLTEGFGIKVQPNAIAAWQYDEAGVTLWADIRCGAEGVHLGGRTLDVCEIVFGDFENVSAFEAGKRFCAAMCPNPVLPKHPVYGSNNWYYAYGNSSHDDIIGDTKIVAEQCAGLDNIPYMVIDDGWQLNRCNGPWTVTNERFPDMKALADEMKALGVRPGIWVRYLASEGHSVAEAKDDWYTMRNPNYLDPSHPEVLDYIRRITKMFVEDWGYQLIKHDFGTNDMFGFWGSQMGNTVTRGDWHFYDQTKTSAEIVKSFYETVREAAGEDCVIIGCNTIPHFCAGLYELNRTGDDTSGFEWDRTRLMGVNTLAFRLIQNGTFYMADADCVGITGAIPWELNRKWLDVLSRTGSPLFVSCKPGVLNDKELDELKAAWKTNSIQKNVARPLDWMENESPAIWEIDGEIVKYNWFDENGAETFKPERKRK